MQCAGSLTLLFSINPTILLLASVLDKHYCCELYCCRYFESCKVLPSLVWIAQSYWGVSREAALPLPFLLLTEFTGRTRRVRPGRGQFHGCRHETTRVQLTQPEGVTKICNLTVNSPGSAVRVSIYINWVLVYHDQCYFRSWAITSWIFLSPFLVAWVPYFMVENFRQKINVTDHDL